jgi:UDP-N-acetylmuramoyl-tripeptide--D-alanyl-D-alanine ligase
MYKEFMISEMGSMLGSTNRIRSHELVRGVSIDSRDTNPGDIFFALKGEHTDGHRYVRDALDNGACAAVVDHQVEGEREFVVNNTLYALGEFAQQYRRKFNPVTIGITGTNGKTTVKNIVGRILSATSKTVYTHKNFNSLIGLPLTLLELSPEHTFLVVEMGTSSPGEIKRLCEIAMPTHGVITNVGYGHLHLLGTVEGVRKEKMALVDSLPAHGIAVVGDGIEQVDRSNSVHFSLDMISDLRVEDVGSWFTYRKERFFTPLLGTSNVYNCCAALCITSLLGIPEQVQKETIANIIPEPGRMEPFYRGGMLIINDTYNANPVSMKAALSFIASLNRRAIAILGDMLELGTRSRNFHEEIGQIARRLCDMVYTYGEEARHYGGTHFRDVFTLVHDMVNHIEGNEVILVKASRALHFEHIVNLLLKEL